MTHIYYVDGEFVHSDSAQLPVTDLAIVRGYGVFDFMRTYGGKPFHLDEHIQRLFRSADLIGLDLPWTHEQVKTVVLETVARNAYAESNVRIVVTGGDSQDFLNPNGTPRLLVLCLPANPPPAHYYTDGVKAITFPYARFEPQAKTLNYIPAIMAMRQARAAGAVEAIYTDRGLALEGTTTNVFAWIKGRWVTPHDEILWGITRQVVLALARPVYGEIEVRDLPLAELLQADEVFISASNKQIMPIVQIDQTVIGSGQPGPETAQMIALFRAYTEQYATIEA
ncbi:MAG: aminotransferase class IV [Anaerolineae bacterium]|jgi:branched-chain amino acid aminotransferase|nr:aminotransferase class IV [Anaerolineae bacterium]